MKPYAVYALIKKNNLAKRNIQKKVEATFCFHLRAIHLTAYDNDVLLKIEVDRNWIEIGST
jgi:hypothetical protein